MRHDYEELSANLHQTITFTVHVRCWSCHKLTPVDFETARMARTHQCIHCPKVNYVLVHAAPTPPPTVDSSEDFKHDDL